MKTIGKIPLVALLAALPGISTGEVTIPGPRADFDGHLFVTNPAPILKFQRKLAPTLTGIDYVFPEQTAHGVALLSRFPPFTVSDRRVHVDGPWYDTAAVNLHFTRGIASVGAIPRYRETDNAPTTVRTLLPSQKWTLMGDPMWWGHAANYAKELAARDPGDPRVGPLWTFGTNHVFVDHQEAFTSLGYYVFQKERWPLDTKGGFARYPAIDIEGTGNWQYQRNCFGWLYQGLARGAKELGLPLVPMLYGQWQFSVGAFYESMRQNGSGEPEYLLPEKDFLAGPDPTLVACQQNVGIISMDGYMQAIWGREPFYKRNSDGALVLTRGLPVFNDVTNTTAYGWNLYLEPGEAKHCLDDVYRQALRMYLQHHRMAGQYPARSGLRKPFLSNCRIGAWSRYTNEGLQGIQQNDRPLPDWLLDMLIGMYLFTADDITLWSSDMNFIPGPVGADYRSIWRYNSHGVLESVVKAVHRYSANEPLHAAGGSFEWCWFNLPVVNKNETPADRYYEKPIALGKLRPFEGHTYLELFVAWPALDTTSRTFKVWVDKNGRRSPAYSIQVKHGRTYFCDAWQLPDGFGEIQGQHVWLRAVDLLGTERTWRGDWRVEADARVPAPPDY
jgi:hypothetical protein